MKYTNVLHLCEILHILRIFLIRRHFRIITIFLNCHYIAYWEVVGRDHMRVAFIYIYTTSNVFHHYSCDFDSYS